MPPTYVITSFGPFADIDPNPSQLVMESLQQHVAGQGGFRLQTLPVSYRAVDAWIAERQLHPPSALLHLGVASNSPQMRLELQAKNLAEHVDIDGEGPSAALIQPQGAPQRHSSFTRAALERLQQQHPDQIQISNDAGSYLCNYLYYQSLHHFSSQGIPVLFVHIADTRLADAPDLSTQASYIAELISTLANGTNVTKKTKA